MRRPNPGHQRRQTRRILTQARRLFARHGYDRVSMDRIASACRVTKPTVYYYFRNKRALLRAALSASWQEQADLLQAFRPGPRFAEGLRRLAHLVLAQTRRTENSEIIRIVLAEAARQPGLGRPFVEVFGPALGRVLLQLFRPHLGRRFTEREQLTLLHHFIGSLSHYTLMHQVVRAGRRYLPSEELYVNLLVDEFASLARPRALGRDQ